MPTRRERAPWWTRAWESRHRRLLTRYATGSAASTVVSQGVLALLYAVGTNVTAASFLAYVSGVPVNYLLQRRWTWGERAGGARLVRYLVTVGISGVVVAALTTVSERLITAGGWSRPVEVALVTVSFLAVNGLVFLGKYVLFDRVVFAEPPAPAGDDA